MFKADMIAPCGLDCNICSQARSGMIPVRVTAGLMTTSLSFVPGTVESFFAGSGRKTDTGSVMNARTTLAGM